MGWGALAHRGTPFCSLLSLFSASLSACNPICLQLLLLHHIRLDLFPLLSLAWQRRLASGTTTPYMVVFACAHCAGPVQPCHSATIPVRANMPFCLVGDILAGRPPIRACPLAMFLLPVLHCLHTGAWCRCLLLLIVWCVFPPFRVMQRMGPLIGPQQHFHRALPRPVGPRSFNC